MVSICDKTLYYSINSIEVYKKNREVSRGEGQLFIGFLIKNFACMPLDNYTYFMLWRCSIEAFSEYIKKVDDSKRLAID